MTPKNVLCSLTVHLMNFNNSFVKEGVRESHHIIKNMPWKAARWQIPIHHKQEGIFPKPLQVIEVSGTAQQSKTEQQLPATVNAYHFIIAGLNRLRCSRGLLTSSELSSSESETVLVGNVNAPPAPRVLSVDKTTTREISSLMQKSCKKTVYWSNQQQPQDSKNNISGIFLDSGSNDYNKILLLT